MTSAARRPLFNQRRYPLDKADKLVIMTIGWEAATIRLLDLLPKDTRDWTEADMTRFFAHIQEADTPEWVTAELVDEHAYQSALNRAGDLVESDTGTA